MERERLCGLYRIMRRIRTFEERTSQLFAEGMIPGFIHVSIGQESVAAGVCAQLKASDYVITNHRGHGHMIAKGADVRKMMAEIFGRLDGYCMGRGGSMHIADSGIGVLGANGIVGGGIPIANGAAFSAQYRGTDQVVACFFGDGASNEGTFHESLNLAAVWHLPVVFVCENNRWAEFTCQEDSLCIEDISLRAQSYGIPGRTVDGIDIFQVMEAAEEAVNRARQGSGPTLLEVKTDRWHGHYEGDPQKYRRPEEVGNTRSRDAIRFFRDYVLERKWLKPAEMEKMDQEIALEVEGAVTFAKNSPAPEVDADQENI